MKKIKNNVKYRNKVKSKNKTKKSKTTKSKTTQSKTKKSKTKKSKLKRSRSNICRKYICFDETSLEKLRYLSDYNQNVNGEYKRLKNKEVSGKLIAKKEKGGYTLYLDEKFKLNNLEAHEADFVDSHYNFHTHPLEAYIYHNCELGWPSKDDYITFLDGYLNYNVIFHCVITVEGVYIMSIYKNTLIPLKNYFKTIGNKLSFIDKVDKWVMDNLNIDKFNYTIREGYQPANYKRIFSTQDYVSFINDSQQKYKIGNKKMRIFNLEFVSWDDFKLNKCFHFYFISKKGKCPITLSEYKK